MKLDMASPTPNVCLVQETHPTSRLTTLNKTAFMNLIETALNVAYLYLVHISQWPPAAVIGFAGAVMTLSKTVLYFIQEYYCDYCMIGHNTFRDILVLWIIPNG
jgi:hypothetical protein